MRLNASLFLALRYLRPKWSFVSVITFLSVLGPTLGVAVLIVVIAVMSGFGRDIRSRIFATQSHLQLFAHPATPGATGYIDEQRLQQSLARLAELGHGATPTVEGPVLIQPDGKATGRNGDDIIAKLVKGIDPASARELTGLGKAMLVGDYDQLDWDTCLIGEPLARELGISQAYLKAVYREAARAGEPLDAERLPKIVVHRTGKLKEMWSDYQRGQGDAENAPPAPEIEAVYTPLELTVIGIYRMDIYDFDANTIITDLYTANRIFDHPDGSAGSIQIWAADPFHLDPVIDAFGKEPLFHGLGYATWMMRNQQLFGALQVEKNMQFFLLIIIVVVAAFSITGTLITVVVQKTREIGVLKAVGATPLEILAIFTLQGGIVGFLGVGLGTALGLTIVTYRNGIAVFLGRLMGQDNVFPAELYQLTQLPAYVEWGDLLRISVSTFAICVLAAVIPALYAASMTPSGALRAETG